MILITKAKDMGIKQFSDINFYSFNLFNTKHRSTKAYKKCNLNMK